MSIASHIKVSLESPTVVVKSYLEDLSDQELLVRPADGANHIAWQLGHLIASEHQLIEQVCPGSLPDLPEGFAEKYTKETSTVDDPGAFHSKEEYLKLMDEQRAGLLTALEKLSDEDLEKPSPESLQEFWATVGAVFSGQGMHWMMHAGQWAVIRRQLGRQPLF
jgi:hypothetical protein